MFKYLKEVNAESKNIKWPTKKVTTYFTAGVIFISIIFAVYIAGLDFVFSEIVNKFIINNEIAIDVVENMKIEIPDSVTVETENISKVLEIDNKEK